MMMAVMQMCLIGRRWRRRIAGEIGGGIIVREDGTMIGVVGMRDDRSGKDAGNVPPQAVL